MDSSQAPWKSQHFHLELGQSKDPGFNPTYALPLLAVGTLGQVIWLLGLSFLRDLKVFLFFFFF